MTAKTPPTPSWLQGLRLAAASVRNPLEAARSLRDGYGDVAAVRFRSMCAVLVSHPALVHQVLVTKNAVFQKDQRYRAIPEVLGDGLLTSHGESWLRQRRELQGIYDADRLAAYAPVIREIAADSIQAWTSSTERVLHDDMKRLTSRLVYRLVLDGDARDLERRSANLSTMLHYWNHRGMQQVIRLPRWLTFKVDRKFQRALQELTADIDESVALHRERHSPSDSLLARLVGAQCGPHAPREESVSRSETTTLQKSRREVLEQSLTFLLAGFETSATLLSWVLWQLAQDASLQAIVAAEFAAHGEDVCLGENPKTPYVDALMHETARLYPPVWGFGREAIENVTLGDFEIAAGSQVLICPYLIHRDPRFFPNPDEFDLERWLEKSAPRPPCSYLPFGAGPRLCIGRPLAWLQIKVILSEILRRFRLEPVAGQVATPLAGITLQPPRGLKLKLVAATAQG